MKRESTGESTSPLLATSTVATEMQTDVSCNPGAISMNRTTQLSIHSPLLSSSLLSKLAGDVIVACTVALGISPVLTVIDKAIVQKAAGTHGVLQSSWNSIGNILKNPAIYFRSPMFLLMWGVYASTYCTGGSFCLKRRMGNRNRKCVFVRTFSIFPCQVQRLISIFHIVLCVCSKLP